MRPVKFMSFRVVPVILLMLSTVVGCDTGDRKTAISTDPSSPFVLSLTSPARLADFDADTLLVSDFKSAAVHFLNKPTLVTTRSLRVSGQPTGIEYSGGLLYVANSTNRSVEVLDLNGVLQFYIGEEPGVFQSVNDIAIDENLGVIYVLDAKGVSITGYNLSTGEETGFLIGPTDLKRPTAIAVDPSTGDILVSDFGDFGVVTDDTDDVPPRVWIFDQNGIQFDAIIAEEVSGGSLSFSSSQSFSTPQGLFVFSGANGKYLFMVDSASAQVQVYDVDPSSATYKDQVKTIGARGSGDGELFYPLDVLVDAATKDVFVADNRNERIVSFLAAGEVP